MIRQNLVREAKRANKQINGNKERKKKNSGSNNGNGTRSEFSHVYLAYSYESASTSKCNEKNRPTAAAEASTNKNKKKIILQFITINGIIIIGIIKSGFFLFYFDQLLLLFQRTRLIDSVLVYHCIKLKTNKDKQRVCATYINLIIL